jgi:triosephosphate isomerase (TIM)
MIHNRLHNAVAALLALERTALLVTTILLQVMMIQSGSAFAPPPRRTHQQLGRPFSGQTQHFADRTPFITGNWKLNPTTRQEAIDLASKIAQSITPSTRGDVALFVPYPFLESVQRAVGNRLCVGAEVS